MATLTYRSDLTRALTYAEMDENLLFTSTTLSGSHVTITGSLGIMNSITASNGTNLVLEDSLNTFYQASTFSGSVVGHSTVEARNGLFITGGAYLSGGLIATGPISASSFSGSYTGSFVGTFTGNGAGITGVTADWDGTHVGNGTINGDLTVTGSTVFGSTSTSAHSIVGLASVTGSFTVTNNVTLGDGSGDTVTIEGATVTFTNLPVSSSTSPLTPTANQLYVFHNNAVNGVKYICIG